MTTSMPAVLDWRALDESARKRALARPSRRRSRELSDAVAAIITRVRGNGDAALRALTRELDGCALDSLRVTPQEFAEAREAIPLDLAEALRAAKARIETFHRATMTPPIRVETASGVICERLVRPIERVGLYAPAGTAPLPSTVLMLGVPAALAGCGQVALCSPPRADGRCDESILYAAELCGIVDIFKIGGAQAIAAMAFGSESVPACDKLFGPGSAWVAEAKRQVSADEDGPAIDMPAGPSEVLVIADAQADARFVAADLLAQAEHSPDAQVVLVTTSVALAESVSVEMARRLETLPRAAIAREALAQARCILVASLADAIDVANRYAPEHLILNCADASALVSQVRHAGSVFVGAFAPETLGDYCSGTNHVLPTDGRARAWSGLSVASFQKTMTIQTVSPRGLRAIGATAQRLARAERLDAHAAAVDVRLAALEATAVA